MKRRAKDKVERRLVETERRANILPAHFGIPPFGALLL
jgi:hypothetical protein